MLQIDQLATPGWIALGSALGALGAWLLNLKRVTAAVSVEHEKLVLQKAEAEAAERESFRTVLLREVGDLRTVARDCEFDKEALRKRLGQAETRVSQAEGKIILLEASNQIMEKWIAFFKERAVVPADFQIKSAAGD